jgi:ribulose-phosphate 3-epimerase
VVTVPRLSAGVITADLTRLGAELDILRGTAAWAHVDVMDGAFCPQLTVGPAFVAAVASTGLPVDAHLMVEEPRRLVPDIAAAGASVITVHAEATRHLHRTLQEMTQLAGEPRSFLRGVAINPGTPVQAVEPVLELADLILVLAVNPGWSGQSPAANTRRRVAAVRALAAQAGADVLVGVDGGVSLANAAEMAGWDIDVLVSGSAIFNSPRSPDRGRSPADNLEVITQALLRAEPAGSIRELAEPAGPIQEVADGRQ